MTELIYVTADDCHLCEHGRQVLDALGGERREIGSDSQESEALAAAGIPLSFLPVLTDRERLIGYGRLSERRAVSPCTPGGQAPAGHASHHDNQVIPH